jgi:hypothetical protein
LVELQIIEMYGTGVKILACLP